MEIFQFHPAEKYQLEIATVPSLQSICIKHLINQSTSKYITSDNCLQLYSNLESIMSLGLSDETLENSGIKNSFEKVKRMVRDRFPTLYNKYGKENITEILGIEFFNELERIMLYADVEKRRIASYRSGSIVEPIKIENLKETDSNCIIDNNNGNNYYPLKFLLQGVEWPQDVDVSKREQYLTPDEFQMTFRMSKEEFLLLSKYDRLRLKKEKLLF